MTTDDRSRTPQADETPTLHVPDTCRRDERFVPTVSGLDPGEHVELTLETSDATGTWRATTTFVADDHGVVDLDATHPEGDGYAGPPPGEHADPDPMGLVWSLAPETGGTRSFEFDPQNESEFEWTVRSVDDGDGPAHDRVETATTNIRPCDPDVVRHEPDEGYPDAWYEPAGDGPHPGVVVLHGSGGRSVEATASLLASHGFAAFACRWLETDDLPEYPVEVPLERVRASIAWFRDRDAVTDDSYGIHGVSMGAQLAFHLAVRDDAVDAVVADAPGHVRFFGAGTGSWTEDDDVLPYVDRRDEPPETFQYEVDGTPAGRELFTQMLDDASAEERRAATIPVEESNASVLLLSGSDDELWPATTFASMLVARLDAVKYDPAYEHHVYHRAGHAFGPPCRPRTNYPAGDAAPIAKGGTPRATAHAAADSWPRVLAHLDDALVTDR